MILVDTNVLSETSRLRPNPKVLDWLATHEDDLWIPAMVLAELRYGVEKLDAGAPRHALEAWLAQLIGLFARKIAPFDGHSADEHGILRARLKREGRPIDAQDSYIAAIALAQNCALATRNVKDFAWTGVRLVNPWEG